MTDIKKSITFRASSIGDCLMGKYLLENIREQYPNARCGIVVGSRGAMLRDLLAGYPWIEVIEANRRHPLSLARLWYQWRGSDLCVTQYAGKAGGRFSLWSKLAARLLTKRGGLFGFEDSSSFNTFLYDHMVSNIVGEAPAELERHILREAGIGAGSSAPKLLFVSTDAVPRFRLDGKPYVVVHLFAGNKGRGLSPAVKRNVLETLSRELTGTQIVVSGGIADKKEALEAAEGLPVVVIAGDASLQDMMNIINESRGVVSVDTGMAHIAAQLGKPLVVLATCLGLHWWKPEQYREGTARVFTVPHIGAHIYKDYPECIEAISAEEVVKAVLVFKS